MWEKAIEITGWNFKEKKQTLKRKLEQLLSMEADVIIELENAELHFGKKRKNEVANWLRNVARVKDEVQGIVQEAERSGWSIPLGKHVDKNTEELNELIDQRNRFQGGLLLDVQHNDGGALLAPELVGQAFQIIKGTILEWLMKKDVLSIGVYGMGGVGKTALMTHIHNELQRQNTFRSVYWITVPENFSIYNLQDAVAKTIRVDLHSEDDEKKRARDLSKALNAGRTFILMLDDLWNHFDLKKVGIPVKVGNGCKLILTTRSLEVCQRMCCQEKVKVDPLSKEEAWNLFQEQLGGPFPPDVKEIAKSVAKECAGLPLGIITMASSMRGVDDVCEWRNALREMQESKVRDVDMEDEIFRVLKFSYNRLNDLALQQCFLYYALYPEDYKIGRYELIECLIDEGIIEEMESWQAKFDRGHSMLNRLEKVCLLEGVTDDKNCRRVKMPDLIRDMGIQIMKVGPSRAMVQSGKELREMPNLEEWKEDLVRCSLMDNKIEEIPPGYSPRCPNLATLLLGGNYKLRSIPASFFEQMNGLKVLDLSWTGIKELPDSISCCVNLTVLSLRESEFLSKVPSLAKLTSLKKLDLMYCYKVKEVPQGIEMLSNLKYLDLDRTNIRELPLGILPKLTHLQFLKLGFLFTVRGKEVASLRNLECLCCRFNDIGEWNTYTTSKHASNLSQYHVVAGQSDDPEYCYNSSGHGKVVYFRDCSIEKGEDAVLPDDVQYLRFKNCNIDCLDGSFASPSVFQSLERLDIYDMTQLCFLLSSYRGGALFSSPTIVPHSATFSLLKHFEIWECPSMKKLFPHGLLSNLHYLETISVLHCENMEELIAMEEEEAHHSNVTVQYTLPKLRTLNLYGLPELKSICGNGKLICNSLQDIWVKNCLRLKKMPLSLVLLDDNGEPFCLPSLRKLRLYPWEWWESVELEHPHAKDVLQPLCHFF